MYNSMILPLLPVSTLNGTIPLFGPVDVFKFAVIIEQFLLKGIKFIFTESMVFSSALFWAASCCTSFRALALLLLQCGSEVANFAAFCTSFPWARHCFWGWLLPQYLHICFMGVFVCLVSSRAVLVCDLHYFEFIKVLHLSEAVHDGGLGSSHFDYLYPGQHIFASDFFIFMYICEFPDYFS